MSTIKRFLKIMFLRLKYFGKGIKIPFESNVSINSQFEENIAIGTFTRFSGTIGRCSYIGKNCSIYAKVGRYTSIADNVNILYGDHPSRVFVSTSPVFYARSQQCGITYSDKDYYQQVKFADENFNVIIGNDVWIGFGATILSGIKIGDGAIIAANATIIKDVEPYTVVGGTPSKVIRNRFDLEDITKLLQYKWWEKESDWIKDNFTLFHNIREFIDFIDERES